MFKQIWAVASKEWLDTRRDPKGLLAMFMMPLIFAVMTYVMVSFIVATSNQAESIKLPVQGAERVQPLIAWLREHDIEIIPAPVDPVAAVRGQEVAMVLVVPEDFGSKFREQRTASLDLIWDQSRLESQAVVGKVKLRIHQWAASTGALRLLTRGVSPDVARVATVTDVNVSESQQMTMRILSGLPMVTLMLAFVAGVGMASEMAAGERERRTLEPLKINPVSYSGIFYGKCLALVIVTFIVAAIGVAVQLMAVAFAPTQELGLRVNITVIDFLLVMLILLPVMLFAATLQLFASFLSKSFKDAQSYNGLLMMLPVAPGIYEIFGASGLDPWKMWVPLLGSHVQIVEIYNGGDFAPGYFLVTVLLSLLLALVFGWLTIQRLKQP